MNRTIKAIKDRIQGKTPTLKRRSPAWPAVRKTHLKREPVCAACGGTSKLEVHHRVPFHIAPERELDPTNLITLCESKKAGINCHLFAGHIGNYSTYNQYLTETIEFVYGCFVQRK